VTLRIKSDPILPSELNLPTSKSYANRYLILAARNPADVLIKDLPSSDDVYYLIEALKKIGLIITGTTDLVVKGSFPDCEQQGQNIAIEIDAGEGGTTSRFLCALLSLGNQVYKIKMKGLLPERPWQEFIDYFTQSGVKISLEKNELSIQGPIDLSKALKQIDSSRSSQFASALALAFSHTPHNIEPIRLSTSEKYWKMTQACLKELGTLNVAKDWSGASYPLALAVVLNQKVFFKNLIPDALQADSFLYDWLISRKAVKTAKDGIVSCELNDRTPFEIDLSHCLDLAPTMAYIASVLEGESILRNLSGLRFKESDRLFQIIQILEQFEAQYSLEGDDLHIIGGNIKKMSRNITTEPDHRMVMSASLFLATYGGGTIKHEECVSKSFKNFFELLNLTSP
jgi:3-phosphoshikimate 1-carboxyvinyltransferase